MSKISTRFSKWLDENSPAKGELRLPAVVVGSGYGGSVAARRLRERGLNVTVLERGSEFIPGDFPNDIANAMTYMRGPSLDGSQAMGSDSGLFELRAGPGVTSVVANGLGGGSLINAGVLYEPVESVFADEHWPDEIRFSSASLQQYLEISRKELGDFQFPEHECAPPKTVAIRRFGYSVKRHIKSLIKRRELVDTATVATRYVAQTIDPEKCSRCGDCVSGCNYNQAKITLRDSYLREAVDPKGSGEAATLLTGATVYSIEAESNSTQTTWRIRIIPTENISHYKSLLDAAKHEEKGGSAVEIVTNILILAAGTFGSTELLQRSKSLFGKALPISPAVGSRFSGNGDALSFSADHQYSVDAIGVGAEHWRGDSNHNSDCKEKFNVGPTITYSIDLREGFPRDNQMLIQDGAVPGAIANLFGLMNSTTFLVNQIASDKWRYPRDFNIEPLTYGNLPVSFELDEYRRSLERRTQVLLTMGHDNSEGSIVWVEGRNASVPYWEDPENIATYKFQGEVLEAACSEIGTKWMPMLLWSPVPESMSSLMSGPKPPKTLTTVHPLGGCVMGSNPKTSVVNHLGQVWKIDDIFSDVSETYDSLYILDGSIIPTSLGCNPILTISALAERALAQSPLANLDADTCNRFTSVRNDIECTYQSEHKPEVFRRYQRQALPVYMEETLHCKRVRLPSALSRALTLAGKTTEAVLELKLKTRDWALMWADAKHPLHVEGTLCIRSANGWLEYEVCAGDESTARLFYSVRDEWINRVPILSGLLHFLSVIRALLTYGATRPRETLQFVQRILRKLSSVLPGIQPDQTEHPRLFQTIRRFLGEATEVRKMQYQLLLRRVNQSSTAPEYLQLSGKKHIEYPASFAELLIWFFRWIHWLLFRAPQRPVLKKTFFDKAGNLMVRLGKPGSGLLLAPKSEFIMDYRDMVERIPVRLYGGGALPTAIEEIARYPLLFSLYLLKTHLFDFRLPDYSGQTLVDELPDSDGDPCHSRQISYFNNAGKITIVPKLKSMPVDLGASSYDPPHKHQQDTKIGIKLLHYPQESIESTDGEWHGLKVRKVKAVLLVHAFAQSGYSFTIPTVNQNMAAYFHEQGYEVWVLDHRISTSLAAHQLQTNMDQIAKYDIPAAVDYIVTSGRYCDLRESDDEKVQIQAFTQCIGAASTCMSLLSGNLSYDDFVQPGQEAPQYLPKLSALIVSQTHPHCIGQPLTQARTWVPAVARDLAGLSVVPFCVRAPVDNLFEAFCDRVFSALPVPEEEQCPYHLSYPEDHVASCKRIRFIEAPLFKHKNINEETHRDLVRSFGDANVRLFAHAAKCVESERLVTENGDNAYVTDANIYRYGALPICFFHGEGNELFHFEAAQRTARHWANIHPGCSSLAWEGIKGNRGVSENGSEGAYWVQPGYGHVDVLLGKDAAKDIYPGFNAAFDYWYHNDV